MFNEAQAVEVRKGIPEMVLNPAQSEGSARNRHRGADQWLFVVSGNGVAKINGQNYSIKPGTLLLIEHGDRHESATFRASTRAWS